MIDSIPAQAHRLLLPSAFLTELPSPLADFPTPPWLADLLSAGAPSPFEPDDNVRTAVRDALRIGGYKPTGRGKPASEYLVRAAGDGSLTPINLAVDACNVVSLHSGFPISVVDLDRARPPFAIATASEDHEYVFNPSGQTIRLGGLACLFDADGPCANAVKDAQRTKTGPATRATLSVLWGCRPHDDRAASAVAWYRDLLRSAGAATVAVTIAPLDGDDGPTA
jgi:DNA/RNA-binding domain of Phe-tRNA-synthetase-like protein